MNTDHAHKAGEAAQNATALPLVAALIPVHTRWKYTRKCLGSLAGITYPNIAIVVINDVSVQACRYGKLYGELINNWRRDVAG